MTTHAHVRPEPAESPWPDERPLCQEAVEACESRLLYWGGDIGPHGRPALEAALREYEATKERHGESPGAAAWRLDLERARERARARVTVSGRQR